MRAASRDDATAFPAWQGMHYLGSMFCGQASLHHVDNDRYGVERWTTAHDVMARHVRGQPR